VEVIVTSFQLGCGELDGSPEGSWAVEWGLVDPAGFNRHNLAALALDTPVPFGQCVHG
jgi:hypothetical protein